MNNIIIYAKILYNGQYRIIIVPQIFYSISNQQINIESQQFLKSLNYEVGKFDVIYYICSSNPLYNTYLNVVAISNKKIETKVIFNQAIDNNIIQEGQNLFSKCIVLNDTGTKIEVATAFKYNYFKQFGVIRYKYPVSFSLNEKILLYPLLYEPIEQQCELVYETQQLEQQYITILPPRFIVDSNEFSTNLIRKNINDLIYNYNDQQIHIAIANMLQSILYDASNPKNFVRFGTYESRLLVFLNKYIVITSNDINLASSKNDIIQNLNTFQRYCLDELFDKQNKSFYIIDSSQFNIWKNRKIAQARLYDKNNIHSLIKLLPENFLIDSNNEDLFTLVNLIGDIFDEYWAAIKVIPSLSYKLQSYIQNYNRLFIQDLLRNYGFDYRFSFNEFDLKETFRFIQDLYDLDINYDKYNKIIMARLLANMPFLLQAKGTRFCIEQILNIFGLSDDLIHITEFIKVFNSNSVITTTNKSYYDCTKTTGENYLTLQINNPSSSSISAILIYCRFSSDNVEQAIIVQNSSLQLIDVLEELDIVYNLTKQYLIAIQSNNNNVYIRVFLEGQQIAIKTIQNTDISKVIFGNILFVDNIKCLTSISQYDYNIYKLGSNVVSNIDFIDSIFNFNQESIIVKQSENVTLIYDLNCIDTAQFQQFTYNSIFSYLTEPDKFYVIQENQQQEMPSKKAQTKQLMLYNSPNIIIGNQYSDRFDNLILNGYENKFENFLDPEYDYKYETYYYKQLEQQRLKYQEYFSYLDLPTYEKMLKFYEILDNNFFNIIKQFVPYSVNAKFGLVLNNNILYRNKVPSMKLIKGQKQKTKLINTIEIPQVIKSQIVKHKTIKIDYIPQLNSILQEQYSIIQKQLNYQLLKFEYNSNYNSRINLDKENNLFLYGSIGLVNNCEFKYIPNILWNGISVSTKVTDTKPREREIIVDNEKKLTIIKI